MHELLVVFHFYPCCKGFLLYFTSIKLECDLMTVKIGVQFSYDPVSLSTKKLKAWVSD